MPASPDVSLNMVDRVSVGDILTRTSDIFPNNVAMVDSNRTLTYRAFEDQANQAANALLSLGLKPGKR